MNENSLNWSWSTVSGVATSTTPALAFFNGTLYMAWKGADNDTAIWYSKFVGGSWEPQQIVPYDARTSAAPSLAVHDGKLWMAWKGAGIENRAIKYMNFDGSSWAPPQQVPHGVGTSASPTLAAYGGKLWMACKDGSNSKIWYMNFDGSLWSQPQLVQGGAETSAAPTMAVSGDKLWMACKGGSDSTVWYASFEENGWSWFSVSGGAGTSGAVALTAYGGKLWMAWEAVITKAIWYTSLDQEGCALPQQVLNKAGTPAAPVLAAYNDKIWMACKSGSNSGIDYASAESSDVWLQRKLSEIRVDKGIPSLAATIVKDGQILARATVGVRKLGASVNVRIKDQFQIGSVMKVLTATFVARMVERKLIKWDTTVADMYPGVGFPAYRPVTVLQLLSHISGLRSQPTNSGWRLPDIVEGRKKYAEYALQDEPMAQPGTEFIYGGSGILVASYLERKLGRPYERLMREELFGPLGMTGAGYGSMSDPVDLNVIDAPWDHRAIEGGFEPIPPTCAFAYAPDSVPGHNGYCDLNDIANFLIAHLQQSTPYLQSQTWQRLQTPVLFNNGTPSPDAPGWGYAADTWCGRETLWHNGATEGAEARLVGVRSRNAGWAVMANAGSNTGFNNTRAAEAVEAAQHVISDYLYSLPDDQPPI